MNIVPFTFSYYRWKAKVKQLERDLDRAKHGSSQVLQRNEQLIKEMENQRQHGGYAQMQIDGLKRELADALVSFHLQDHCIHCGYLKIFAI